MFSLGLVHLLLFLLQETLPLGDGLSILVHLVLQLHLPLRRVPFRLLCLLQQLGVSVELLSLVQVALVPLVPDDVLTLPLPFPVVPDGDLQLFHLTLLLLKGVFHRLHLADQVGLPLSHQLGRLLPLLRLSLLLSQHPHLLLLLIPDPLLFLLQGP